MRFFYGNKNPLRVLDEMEFWKRQEAEHTVIRSGGNISPQLNEAILCLIEYAMKESQCFLQLVDDILTNSKAAKDPIARTVVKHIRRESEYFIGISQTILYESNCR